MLWDDERNLPVYMSSAVGVKHVPVKRHKRNKRINKKWLHYFGTKVEHECFVTALGVFVSPEQYAVLAQTLQERKAQPLTALCSLSFGGLPEVTSDFGGLPGVTW